MEYLHQFKIELKQSLPSKGITFVLKILKEALPESSPAYNQLIQLESEYTEHKIRTIEGILDNDEIQKTTNLIRKRLLDLIDSLKEEDFSADTPNSILESDQRIRRGHVLYQVPKTMQLGIETRCLVRIAFEKMMLIEDLDLDEDTEVRSNVRISDYMKVEMVDPSATAVFSIRNQSSPVQFIDKDDYTEWRFYVKPLQSGKHILEVKVTIILMINGREVPRERTLEESVVIITEPVEESGVAFQQLEESFVMGGNDAFDLDSLPELEMLPRGEFDIAPPAPLPSPQPSKPVKKQAKGGDVTQLLPAFDEQAKAKNSSRGCLGVVVLLIIVVSSIAGFVTMLNGIG